MFKCCHGDKHLRVLTYKMAAKINWHRYGTQLRNCHPMYKRVLCSCDVNIPAVLHMLRNAVQFSSRDINGASFLRLLCTARSWFAVDVSRSWCRQTGWFTHTQLNHLWWFRTCLAITAVRIRRRTFRSCRRFYIPTCIVGSIF